VLLAALARLGEVGGLALAAGFLTPLAALGIAVVMLTAIGAVHWSKGFWNTAGGYEFNLVLLTVALAVRATGPGASRSIARSAGTTTSAAHGGRSASPSRPR
jgi:putative oxidoreductase